jgi:hypothetical protein
MSEMGRREWLESMGIFVVAGALRAPAQSSQLTNPKRPDKMKLDLSDFQPKSMLHVPETKVPRSRYPVIDIHTHLSTRAKSVNGVGVGEKMKFNATPERFCRSWIGRTFISWLTSRAGRERDWMTLFESSTRRTRTGF